MIMTLRRGWAGWGEAQPRVRAKGFWNNVPKWNEDAKRDGVRRKLFTSLMDWLDLRVPLDWFADYLQIIRDTPWLDHLTLTKRPQNFHPQIKAVIDHYGKAPSINGEFCAWLENWLSGEAPPNVWFGFTAGTRKTWIERSRIAWEVPAEVTWCSAEPLLEPLDFIDIMQDEECKSSHPLNWIVVGGESGHNRRPGAGVEGIEMLARQAKALNVPVFVKQDFGSQPGKQGRISDEVWSWKEFPNELLAYELRVTS